MQRCSQRRYPCFYPPRKCTELRGGRFPGRTLVWHAASGIGTACTLVRALVRAMERVHGSKEFP